MDNFLSEILNPAARVGGIINGIITFVILMIAKRYWSYRSAKSIQRRIRNMENDKLIIDNLAKSDRSILLFSFKRLFEVLTMLFFACSPLPLFLNAQARFDWINMMFALVLFVAGLGFMFALQTLQKVGSHPESVVTINQEIDSLKARLSKLTE